MREVSRLRELAFRQLLRDGERVLKVIDRLIVGGAFERAFAGLRPVWQRKILALRFSVMPGD